MGACGGQGSAQSVVRAQQVAQVSEGGRQSFVVAFKRVSCRGAGAGEGGEARDQRVCGGAVGGRQRGSAEARVRTSCVSRHTRRRARVGRAAGSPHAVRDKRRRATVLCFFLFSLHNKLFFHARASVARARQTPSSTHAHTACVCGRGPREREHTLRAHRAALPIPMPPRRDLVVVAGATGHIGGACVQGERELFARTHTRCGRQGRLSSPTLLTRPPSPPIQSSCRQATMCARSCAPTDRPPPLPPTSCSRRGLRFGMET